MTADTSTSMFEILDETDDDLFAIHVGRGSRRGYHELYSILIERTQQYERVHVSEEVPDWTFMTFLTHLHGVVPDLRYGPSSTIDRYAAVGDSLWAKLLFDWWRAIRPIWPIAPDQMRYFDTTERTSALQWLREVDEENSST